MHAVAARTEAALVGLLRGEQNIGGVHDRQNMAARGVPVGRPPGSDQHLVRTHRRVGQEVVELKRLVAALGQPVNTQRPFALHRVQQRGSNRRPPLIAKSPKRRFVHLMPSRSTADAGIESKNRTFRKSFRGCTTTVG